MKSILTLLLSISSIAFSQNTSVDPFLESIVGQFPNVRDLAISNDETEVFFSAQSVIGDQSVIVSARKTDNQWSDLHVVSFSGHYFDIEPFLSKDGLRLYYASNRPLDNTSTATKDFDIWYVTRERIDSEWSAPKNIGSPINTEMDEFYPVITDSKNLYFTLDNTTLQQKDDIYVSEFINGNYSTPKPLSSAINSAGYEFNAFVAPDESFLIYTCYNREDGFGSGDLYISYRNEDLTWTPSENMGEKVNSDKMDYCPFVNLNTNTLYFTSKRIHNQDERKQVTSIEGLIDGFNSYANGASRLFKTTFKK